MLPLEQVLTQMLAMLPTPDCAQAEQLPLQHAVNRICAEDIISRLTCPHLITRRWTAMRCGWQI